MRYEVPSSVEDVVRLLGAERQPREVQRLQDADVVICGGRGMGSRRTGDQYRAPDFGQVDESTEADRFFPGHGPDRVGQPPASVTEPPQSIPPFPE